MSDDESVESDEGPADLDAEIDGIRSRFDELRTDLGPVHEDVEPVRTDLEPVHELLEDARTEADLDAVEAALEPVAVELEPVREAFDRIREAFDEIELPEPEGEAADEAAGDGAGEDEGDEENGEEEEGIAGPLAALAAEHESLEADLDDVESEIEVVADEIDEIESGVDDQRGPYAEDVVDELGDASGDIESTRWTEEGHAELREAVEDALSSINDVLGTSLRLSDDEELLDRLLAALDRVGTEIEEADLDPDEDDEEIAALLETTDNLQSAVDDATAWDDLEIREQLRREGYYDVLEHVKDFPPEWHALKVHEKQGNVEMVLLALESLDSDFMEGHCLDALERMGPEEAIEPMCQRANRRDTKAMSILGTIGRDDEQVVETLLDYVDSNPTLQRPAMRALGEVGSEKAVQPIANQLVADEAVVRSAAARALGLIGDTRAITPLAEVLAEDDEDTVRASAAWALNQVGTREALEVVGAYEDDRAHLVQAEAAKADFEPVA